MQMSLRKNFSSSAGLEVLARLLALRIAALRDVARQVRLLAVVRLALGHAVVVLLAGLEARDRLCLLVGVGLGLGELGGGVEGADGLVVGRGLLLALDHALGIGLEVRAGRLTRGVAALRDGAAEVCALAVVRAAVAHAGVKLGVAGLEGDRGVGVAAQVGRDGAVGARGPVRGHRSVGSGRRVGVGRVGRVGGSVGDSRYCRHLRYNGSSWDFRYFGHGRDGLSDGVERLLGLHEGVLLRVSGLVVGAAVFALSVTALGDFVTHVQALAVVSAAVAHTRVEFAHASVSNLGDFRLRSCGGHCSHHEIFFGFN